MHKLWLITAICVASALLLSVLELSAVGAPNSKSGANAPASPRAITPSTPVRGLPPEAQIWLRNSNLTELQRSALIARGVAQHRIVRFRPATRFSTAHYARLNGALVMPDLTKSRVQGLRLGTMLVGNAYVDDGSFSIILRGGRGRAIGVLSLSGRNTLTISLDPNRDGMADYVEIWAGAILQTIFVRDGLGDAFLEALRAGRDAMCMDVPGAEELGGWMTNPNATATLNMCGKNRRKQPPGYGNPSGDIGKKTNSIPNDPWLMTCASLGRQLSRPARFDSIARAGGGGESGGGFFEDSVGWIIEQIPDVGVRTAASEAAFIAFGGVEATQAAVAAVVERVGAGEALAATAETAVSTVVLPVAAFLAVTFTPSPAGGEEEERQFEEWQAEREAAAAREASNKEPPPTPDAGGGAEKRPSADSSNFGLLAMCRRMQNQRQEWQTVVNDGRRRNFTECLEPTGAPTRNNSPFCRFLQSAMAPESVDLINTVANAGGNSSGSRQDVGNDRPDLVIRDRMLAAVRMRSGLSVVVCDPRVCQPAP